MRILYDLKNILRNRNIEDMSHNYKDISTSLINVEILL